MDTFYLGIDVSKGYADFIILDQTAQPVLPCFQLDDTARGHQLLHQMLTDFFGSHPQCCIKAAVESTGGYEDNWYHALHQFSAHLPMQVTRINPIGIRHHSKAAMKRTTTDRIAARSIADYQIHHDKRIRYDQDEGMKSLRRFWSVTQIQIKARTQMLNELETLLYTAHPGLMQFKRDNMPQWMLSLIKRYPDAGSLGRARASTIAKIPYISAEKAKVLVTEAKTSVASATDEMTQMAIVSLVEQIESLNRQIKNNEKLLETKLHNRQVDLLLTFKSIGIHSAVGLLCEIGCVHRFQTVKQLSAFVGVHPVFKESGDGLSCVRMSKQGRKKVRAILFIIALNAIQHNPLIKALYEKEITKGKAKMAAIGTCMHKILRIVYGMLKHDKPFDPDINKKHQERSKPKEKNMSKQHEYTFDECAPISAKQRRKRNEQRLKSQSDSVTVGEINAAAQHAIS
jgi:transposase